MAQNTVEKRPRKLWSPPSAPSRVHEFIAYVNALHGLTIRSYHELHDYSIKNYTFWLDAWMYLGILSSVPPDPKNILEAGDIPEKPSWFPGARLNYAENLLNHPAEHVACSAINEIGSIQNYTYGDLRCKVTTMAAALKANGIKTGDRVAAIITNSVEAIVLALAVSSIGAIYSSTAPDMGSQGILDRYIQITPKIIITESEVVYGGKAIDILAKVQIIVDKMNNFKSGLQQIVFLPSRKSLKDLKAIKGIERGVAMSEFLTSGDGKDLVFEQLPFDHPLYIMYSSGTTGAPKCIVHSGGGVLMQSMKNLAMGYGLRKDDTLFQYTTTGWMMWQLMIGALAIGARMILYDGTPFYPTISAFLQIVNDQRVTVFGTSPRFLTEVQGRGIDPMKLAPFESLRVISVTGSVLTAPVMEWTQQAWAPRNIHIVSTSGGTDICASFVTGTPSLPVYSGEIQAKALGMDVQVFSTAGENIEHTGEPGEMVCIRPHPSIPFFWGDTTRGDKFREAYYTMFPGIWRQGDFMLVNPSTKGIMILGRSDGVLNPSGVRFGSGEIYSILERFTDVMDDAICVGQRRPQDADEQVLLFLKMRQGQKLSLELENDIKVAIRQGLSARHVPSYIFQVEDIPYTVNGKKIEIAVKQLVSGREVKPSGAVANPEAFKLYHKYSELETLAKAKL